MKKVALLIKNLAPGGAERAMSRLSEILNEEYEIYFIVFNKDIMKYSYKGKLISLDIPIKDGKFNKILMNIKRIIKLRKIKKQLNIDVTISFLDTANIINILSRQKDKIIVSIRNFKGLESKNSIIDKIQTYFIPIFYNFADMVVPVSKLIKEELKNNYNIREDKLEVIYNPYDVNEIYELAKQKIDEDTFKFYRNHIVVSSVGRLDYQKGFWHLIKAISIVKEEIPNIGLVIIGEGIMRNKIEKLIKECKLEDNVLLLGHKSNPFKYIYNSQIYTLTSLYEGFPNALVEAMSCGTVVLASDCKSGPREILYKDVDFNSKITKRNLCDYGVLVPNFGMDENWDSKDIKKEEYILAKSIIELINDDEKRETLAIKGKKRAYEFNYENCKERYNYVINKVTK